MTQLFKRVAILDVGTVRVEGLRVAFKIEKTAKAEVNTLEVQVWNLAEQTRRALQKKHERVRLVAGYEGELEMIFSGDLETVTHTRNGPDWITKLSSGDGGAAKRTKRVSKAYAPGVKADFVLADLARDAGLGLGNVVAKGREAFSRGGLAGVVDFAKGLVVNGQTVDEIERLALGLGLDVSIQDGALQLVEPAGTVGAGVVLLEESTGLIGSPEVGEDGVIKARALIRQRLMPAHRVRLRSFAVDGFYRIEKVTFVGDTEGQDWYADLELKAVAT